MFYFTNLQRTVVVFTVCFSLATAVNQAEDEVKSVNLKIGFDLEPESNDDKKKISKESSLDSTEEKGKAKEKVPDKQRIEKTASDSGLDDSGSESDRRYSTKGLRAEDYEPERSPRNHEEDDKAEDVSE